MNNIFSNLKQFLTGKSTAPTVAPATTRTIKIDLDNQSFVDQINAINQARDEAVKALQTEAQAVVDRIKARTTIIPLKAGEDLAYHDHGVVKFTREDGSTILIKPDAPVSTIVTDVEGIPTIKPARKRKPKGSDQ